MTLLKARRMSSDPFERSTAASTSAGMKVSVLSYGASPLGGVFDPADAVVQSSEEVGAEIMHKPIKPAQLRALMHHMLADQQQGA